MTKMDMIGFVSVSRFLKSDYFVKQNSRSCSQVYKNVQLDDGVDWGGF
jgi:hypothetical protein